MKYIFETTATMKEYNNTKWWIDSGIVTRKYIEADTIAAAVEKFRELVQEQHYISISDNAIKHKQPMFIDTADGTKQTGFVITGKTEFESGYKWVSQYIDLWVNILTVVATEF